MLTFFAYCHRRVRHVSEILCRFIHVSRSRHTPQSLGVGGTKHPNQTNQCAPSPGCFESSQDQSAQDLTTDPACPTCMLRPTVTPLPTAGECLAAPVHPTRRCTGPNIGGVPAHAIRHANDGSGAIHDLQTHGPTTIPLPSAAWYMTSDLI